jgi:hypothetical protein
MCVCACVRDSGEGESSIENNVGCEGVMACQPSAVARTSWNWNWNLGTQEPRNPRRDDPGLAEREGGLEKPCSLCLVSRSARTGGPV